MTDFTGIDDISKLIPYYDDTRKQSDKHEVGQIVFTPVTYTERRHSLYSIRRSDSTDHNAASFEFRSLKDDVDFRKKTDRLPIKALALGETEELLAIKAKMRPCLIIAKLDKLDLKSLPEGTQKNMALNSFDSVYLLAPIYSISSGAKVTTFGPVMTARIKCMMYPEFVYVPANASTFQTPKVIRLDRIFWSHLIACTEPCATFFSKEIMGICWSQIKIIAGENPSQDYSDLRELLLAYLPAECR